jgi:DNA polymerase I-like protein with 3'-5' exonuclease and polymerase domains
VFEGFLKNAKGGKLIAGAAGLTNTLRFKHRELVNLPGVDKAWGEEIRGCLFSPEGYTLCGSDMSSLEDNTKRHYMYEYDPVYVDEMSDPNFDSHLDLATFAGAVTKQEVLDYVCKKAGSKNLKPIRKNFKAANYACIYGVGSETLGRTLGISPADAQKLIDAYWGRNWAVTEVVKSIETKRIGKEMWLKNPVSGFWYSLRAEKDIFSTLNQGTGVYCFDLWVMKFRAKRPQLTGQFHDEVILCIKNGAEDKCRQLLTDAIAEVNEELKLNVTLSVDIQFGDRYSDIH